MGTDVDVTLLSKFERNVRFPTNDQIDRLSRYLQIPIVELKSIVISDKIVKELKANVDFKKIDKYRIKSNK